MMNVKTTTKKVLAVFILVIAVRGVSAQKSVVTAALSKYGIDAAILDSRTAQQPDDYAYDAKFSSITTGKQSVTLARYDPSGPAEEHWTVISVDGNAPTRSEINTFRKNHRKEPSSAQADDATWKIEKETPDQLVISYKQDPATAPKEASFMKDCRFYLTVNLRTKRMEQVEAINEKTLKIKMVNAEKFDLVVKYSWNEAASRYFTISEDLYMLAKFLGQGTAVQTISEYSNYTKK